MVEYSQQELLEALSELSRFFGVKPDFVLAGGGNTSAKQGQRLFVKASGFPLATITPEGFIEMDREALAALLVRKMDPNRTTREQDFKDAIMAARVDPKSPKRPSVEAVLHHLMPRRFVVHTHATVLNMFTCCTRGQELIERLGGDQVLWIPSVDPGWVLAQTLRQALVAYQDQTGRGCPRAVVMANHGLVVCGDTPEEVRQHTDWLIDLLKKYLAQLPAQPPFGPTSPMDSPRARVLVNVIGPALRSLLATEENLKIAPFDDSPEAMELTAGAEGSAVVAGGAIMPDQIVYCRAFTLWFDPGADVTPEALVPRLRQAIAEHQQQKQSLPQVILVRGLGMFTAGDDINAALTTRALYLDSIRVMAGAQRLGGISYLRPDLRDFLENWEVEAYRRNIARSQRRSGRAAGKVALVTGAAQGFGLEIARDLAEQGAHVVLTDLNLQGAAEAAALICARHGTGRAVALSIDVTDGSSMAAAVHQAVRYFGGFDLVVANAGVLRAGSVKTQSAKDFDFVTSVNYKGFFLCVQNVAPILAIQHLARPSYWSDIIQVNSKSGLQGSNRNGAYAGSKFGGIGLTQSFALELVEDGVKVNAVCPGNFFDGPLWSDPNQGLFVQYLRSGKVPGARTIEEVRRFYETKVPMGRGCTTGDVMKAIYYLMDQKYETGQALPVTGGQVMLA